MRLGFVISLGLLATSLFFVGLDSLAMNSLLEGLETDFTDSIISPNEHCLHRL